MAELVAAGIDVGQRCLDLGLAPTGQTTRSRNEPGDIARLVERPAHTGVARVVLEAIKPASPAWMGACAAIEAELDARLQADAARLEAHRLRVSIPGIGPRVAGVLICDLPELGQRDRKSIAGLAGLALHISQSGNAPPRAMIGGGRPCVRAALSMSALVAVRHDPHFRAAYRALRDPGKPAKLGLIAVARRIRVTANAVLKTKTPYQSQNTP